MTKAKKINAVAKSNPAIILFLRATLRRGAGPRGCRRGSNLEDLNFYHELQMKEEKNLQERCLLPVAKNGDGRRFPMGALVATRGR